MNVLAVFHSASARIEEKMYSLQVGLSVYVGMVRASLQEKIPLLQNHVWAAVGVSIFVVVVIQSIILVVALCSGLISLISNTPRVIRGIAKPPVRVIQPIRSLR
jgi:hypothetical protein